MKGNEVVRVKRPAATDWQGDPTGAAAEFDIPACQIWPRTSSETPDRGRVIIEGWNVYVPPKSANTIYATDVVVIRGEEFIVVGVPGQYDLKGRDKGLIAIVSKTGQ